MTFSIVARCERTGQVGVAAITALQAVGKFACHGMANVGAIASQATLNPYLAYDGLRLLEKGLSPQEVLDQVLSADPCPQRRQVGVIDTQGRTAIWSGNETLNWSGHRCGRGFSTQGNRLAGPHVLERIAQTMHDTEHLDLADRFFLALEAGSQAGGDKEGERSANIVVFSYEEYPLCDIRIDDHDDLMPELRRLFQLYKDEVLKIVMQLPKRSEIRKTA